MKKYLCFLFLIVLMGCSATRKIGDDYFNKPYEEDAWPEAADRLKYDYLQIKEPTLDPARNKQYLAIAREHLLTSPYRDIYDIEHPVFDNDLSMPSAASYVFIHFPVYDFYVYKHPEYKDTTYLVVISRLLDRSVYADKFEKPAGDNFYRYNEILKTVQ